MTWWNEPSNKESREKRKPTLAQPCTPPFILSHKGEEIGRFEHAEDACMSARLTARRLSVVKVHDSKGVLISTCEKMASYLARCSAKSTKQRRK